MAVYAITGKLGSGKTLVSVGRIMDYLSRGRPVATNLDLHLEKYFGSRSKAHYLRLPDIPTINDLLIIGKGNESLDESKNGLLVLDECGVFFNSRDWADKGRQAIISWLLHSRKLGWDVILIVQDIQLIDKQIRTALLEHVGICKRTDRLSIPFIGGILKFFKIPHRPPRMHLCSIKYGTDIHALVVDRWFYRGLVIQNAYDTRQIFSASYSPGAHSVLSPFHRIGRFLPPVWWQIVKMWLVGEVYRPPVTTSKHPLIQKIMRLPPERRLEFYRRFEQCGAFA